MLVITADGASCNRKFFRMHKSGKGLTYKTVNIASEERRPIFFISDPPHLVKTVRNAWANSGHHDNTRELCVSVDVYFVPILCGKAELHMQAIHVY